MLIINLGKKSKDASNFVLLETDHGVIKVGAKIKGTDIALVMVVPESIKIKRTKYNAKTASNPNDDGVNN